MTPKAKRHSSGTQVSAAALYLLFVLVTSFFTYFYRYNFPPYPFWDEPYHIAAAQKYLNGVFYMEPHPPLGKLMIALGEKITQSNSPEKNKQFITTDYATGLGEGFSFSGYRLFPSLMGWLTAPILFFIFLWFSRNPALAALFSFLYIFDNAQIVHTRGAMVDVPVTFFGLLLVLTFLHVQDRTKKSLLRFSLLSIAAGVCFGLIMTTKAVGLIFILLFPAVVWRLLSDVRRIALFGFLSGFFFLLTYAGVWQIHFALGQRIVPELHSQGYYLASPEYKKILDEKKGGTLSAFPLELRDHLKFLPHYEKGVPRLDLCKPDENGSPWYFWPFGARTINYRWERADNEAIRYLYLQSNPLGWACGFLGVILSSFFLLSHVLLPTKEKLKHGFFMLLFLGLYVSYMVAVSQIDRVMYLYHYFIPLLFSYILFGLSILNLSRIGPAVIDENRRVLGMTVIGLLIFASFQLYRPFAFYEPITKGGVIRRAILPLWELTCVGCEKESMLVVPRSGK